MKVLLVDGYNVIRSTPLYSNLAVDDYDSTEGWNSAREALIADVATLAQGGTCVATIVFDGGGNPSSTGEIRHVAGISVIFSRAGTDADSAIENLAREARERGDEVIVVTSDAATQWTVFGRNVTRMSSLGFTEEIRAINEEWREHNPSTVSKNTVAERVDPRVRNTLAKWARGQR